MSHLLPFAPPPTPAAEAPPHERLLDLVQRVSSAGRSLRRLLAEQAAAVELTDGDVLVVWLCADAGSPGTVQGELATAIGVSPALMSGTVERLRQRGLIEMQRSSLDRRRQVWRTTDAGRRLLAQLAPVLAQVAQQFDSRIPKEQQQTAGNLCDHLTTAAHEIPAGASVRVLTREKERAAA